MEHHFICVAKDEYERLVRVSERINVIKSLLNSKDSQIIYIDEVKAILGIGGDDDGNK